MIVAQLYNRLIGEEQAFEKLSIKERRAIIELFYEGKEQGIKTAFREIKEVQFKAHS